MKSLNICLPSWASVVKAAIALGAGLLSSCLVYAIIVLLLHGLASLTLLSPLLKLSIFLESWAFSTILLWRKTNSVAEVVARSFLLGAVEWLALVCIVVLLFKGRPLLATALTVVCAAGFGVTRQVKRPVEGAAALRAKPPSLAR